MKSSRGPAKERRGFTEDQKVSERKQLWSQVEKNETSQIEEKRRNNWGALHG